ncbi:MAG: alpha/beta hydrolase [Candidatus Geothermincolia bacterium]
MDRSTGLVQTAAALLPALRETRKRRVPRGRLYTLRVGSPDGVDLACTMVAGNPREAVVVAHPAVVGSRYRQVVSLADELAATYSVLLFDFRGHGSSGGKCRLGFSGPALDLAAVINRARGLGFEKVGVAGFSMGAGAAFLAASSGVKLDALASIGCPPVFPEMPLWREHPRATAAVARLLGLRLDPRADDGPSPVEVAGSLAQFPKLLVFGEVEVAPEEDIERFVRAVAPPVETMRVEGAWHADLMGREPFVREWFERSM